MLEISPFQRFGYPLDLKRREEKNQISRIAVHQQVKKATLFHHLGSSTQITEPTSNYSSTCDSNDVGIKDGAPKAPEDAEDENSNSCDQEGYCGAKRVRRSGGGRSPAKAAIQEQGKAIQPTKEFDEDNDFNHCHLVDESNPFYIASTKRESRVEGLSWRKLSSRVDKLIAAYEQEKREEFPFNSGQETLDLDATLERLKQWRAVIHFNLAGEILLSGCSTQIRPTSNCSFTSDPHDIAIKDGAPKAPEDSKDGNSDSRGQEGYCEAKRVWRVGGYLSPVKAAIREQGKATQPTKEFDKDDHHLFDESNPFDIATTKRESRVEGLSLRELIPRVDRLIADYKKEFRVERFSLRELDRLIAAYKQKKREKLLFNSAQETLDLDATLETLEQHKGGFLFNLDGKTLQSASSTQITEPTSNYCSTSDSNDVAIKDSAPKNPEDAEDENCHLCEQEGYCGAKSVRRAGGHCSRAKAAIRESGKAIQPTKEFDEDDDLNDRHLIDESDPFDSAATENILEKFQQWRDGAPKASEDAVVENRNLYEQEGSCGAKRVRRAGGRRSRAKAAICEQGKAIQPTPLLTGLRNHPSIYIHLGRPPPHRGLTPQNVWNRAFDIWSTAAEVYKGLLHEAGFGDFLKIRPIMINLPGYICALAERYFSETHTLHLGTFEIGPTPLAWTMITGIRFGGDSLNPPDITPEDCAKLLGLKSTEGVFSDGKFKLDALCLINLDFTKDPAEDDLEWMFRRLIVYLVGSCFFSGTDLMVPIRLVSAMSNIQKISCYDWGAATFSAFLRGMRVKTSQCSSPFLGFYPFLLFWAYEHLPCMRPVTELGLDTFPRACRWESTKMEAPILSDFIWYRLELEYLEEDEVNFNPYEKLLEKGCYEHEVVVSQQRIGFQGLESCEVYMGERNLRQFGHKIQIPYPPPAKRFSDRSDDIQKVFSLDLCRGLDGSNLVEDEGHDYADWFRTHSLGRIVKLEQFPGQFTLGYRFLEPWLHVHRDGYKMMTPQDLQSLTHTSDQWKEKCQSLETKLKSVRAKNQRLKKNGNYWKGRASHWKKKFLAEAVL